jgi:hypothetical protein
MTFMSKSTKLPTNSVLCFLNQKTEIYVNSANVLWVAFSIPSGSLSLVKNPVYVYASKRLVSIFKRLSQSFLQKMSKP